MALPDPDRWTPRRERYTALTFRWFRYAITFGPRRCCWIPLGIRRLRLVLGGSIGGMQALDWTLHDPERVERAVIIGVTPVSAMGLALNHLQRQAIQNDPDWADGHYLPQRSAAARAGAGPADRHDQLQVRGTLRRAVRPQSQPQWRGSVGAGRPGWGPDWWRFDIAGYLDHQGDRFMDRFDANSYLAILRTMDTWDPLHGHFSAAEGFSRIRAGSALSASARIGSFRPTRCATLPIHCVRRASRPTTGR